MPAESKPANLLESKVESSPVSPSKDDDHHSDSDYDDTSGWSDAWGEMDPVTPIKEESTPTSGDGWDTGWEDAGFKQIDDPSLKSISSYDWDNKVSQKQSFDLQGIQFNIHFQSLISHSCFKTQKSSSTSQVNTSTERCKNWGETTDSWDDCWTNTGTGSVIQGTSTGSGHFFFFFVWNSLGTLVLWPSIVSSKLSIGGKEDIREQRRMQRKKEIEEKRAARQAGSSGPLKLGERRKV